MYTGQWYGCACKKPLRSRVSGQLLQRTSRLLGCTRTARAVPPFGHANRFPCHVHTQRCICVVLSCPWIDVVQHGPATAHVVLHPRLRPLVLGGTVWPSVQHSTGATHGHLTPTRRSAYGPRVHGRLPAKAEQQGGTASPGTRPGAGLGQAAKALQGCVGLPALLCMDEHILEHVEVHRTTTGAMHGIIAATITTTTTIATTAGPHGGWAAKGCCCAACGA